MREMMFDKMRRESWGRSMACEDVGLVLAGASGDATDLGRRARRHVDQCLRCQADLAQHRKLGRALKGLRGEVIVPPAGFLADVISQLDEEPEPARPFLSTRRIAYASGLAAAGAAGAVSAIVFTARSRRARLAG